MPDVSLWAPRDAVLTSVHAPFHIAVSRLLSVAWRWPSDAVLENRVAQRGHIQSPQRPSSVDVDVDVDVDGAGRLPAAR